MRVNNGYPEIGEVQEIHVQERSTGGAVKILTLRGTKGEVSLENEYSIRDFFSPGDQPVVCNGGTKSTAMKILPSAYFVINPVMKGNQLSGFDILGGGYGHGVGMSQNGAKYLAENGADWENILNMFYQNIIFCELK